MSPIPWTTQINFASALLLHSCTTIVLKETFNCLEIGKRLLTGSRKARAKSRAPGKTSSPKVSAILDGYTSIFSGDRDGEQAELYFTNTGIALLAVSLASSVGMNLLLSNLTLNMIVAATFGLTFAASLAVGHAKYTLPFMALRRAGRFIWSDTPFVNFFTLIYIATVLRGQSTLRLQDYVTFRSIAVFEAVLMKAKLASADVETQVSLMRKLIQTERVVLSAKVEPYSQDLPILSRKDIKAFSTRQRMMVMFCKTSVVYEFGCVEGTLGPVRLPVPAIGIAVEESDLGWKLCRLSEDVMILADCLAESKPKDRWSRLMTHMHGILLRMLRKKRVVYLVRRPLGQGKQEESRWHSNPNLVTGVSIDWLNETFSLGEAEHICAVAGMA